MQKLGRVITLTPSQNLVVKTGKAPKIGSSVVDDNLKDIGRVFDIIGPVTSPYTIVRPSIRDPGKLASKQLYLLPLKKDRSRDR